MKQYKIVIRKGHSDCSIILADGHHIKVRNSHVLEIDGVTITFPNAIMHIREEDRTVYRNERA